MMTLSEAIGRAENTKTAIGHFNVATIDMLYAVVDAAERVSTEAGEKLPVLVGVSEGERAFLGIKQLRDLITSIKHERDYPIYLNADHSYSIEAVQQVIDAEYDMVIFDAAGSSYDENIAQTAACVRYRNESGQPTLIEAEFGFIGAGSDIKDKLPDGVSEATMTDPDEARTFVVDTGIDLLAPSVGTVHGVVASGNPQVQPDRISEIRSIADIPLVLHGGSGTSESDFRQAIAAGISVIHISTELRIAYKKALKETVSATDELAPYKYLQPAKEAVSRVVEKYIRLFNNM